MNQAVYSITLDQLQWIAVFKEEYKRRTGITWNEDAGRTDEEALDRYFPETCPMDAVFDQMNKYDLVDVTDPWMGG